MTFESVIGYFQPLNARTMILTTTNARGVSHGRIVARLDTHGQSSAWRRITGPEFGTTEAWRTPGSRSPWIGSERAVSLSSSLHRARSCERRVSPRHFVPYTDRTSDTIHASTRPV